MAVTAEEARSIARLARLALSDEACRRYAADLERFLNVFDQLQKIDTSGVEPLLHLAPGVTPLRDDRVTEPLGAERVAALAPASHGSFIRVPRMVGDDDDA